MTEAHPIQTLLSLKLIVCCGSGGVGKTTLAATLAVLGAQMGRKVLVLTIDPARRLADSFGVGPLGNEEVRIPPEALGAMSDSGELWALMLDAKRTFDSLVSRFAPSEEIRQRILNNVYYQQISSSMVGSQEYMATEKLLDVREKGSYDLVVLDTPPSRHALDFLRAPSKLRSVLEEGVLNWLLRPSSQLMQKVQSKILGGDSGFLYNLEKMLGLSMLSDLSEFVSIFKDLLDGFRLRAARTESLLSGEGTTFVLIASPNLLSLREANYFREQLDSYGYHFSGFLINRTLPLHALPESSPDIHAVRNLAIHEWIRQFPKEAPPPLVPAGRPPLHVPINQDQYHHVLTRLHQGLGRFLDLAEVDRQNLSWLRSFSEAPLFLEVPELPSDVHDVAGLKQVGQLLLEASRRSRLEDTKHAHPSRG